MSSQKKLIRLLIVDEAIAGGGVERLWLALMPELAKLCDRLVWLLPNHRLDAFKRAVPKGSSIHFELFSGTKMSVGKIKRALAKRVGNTVGRGNPTFQKQVEEWLGANRLEEVIREHRITHILYPALFTQRFPKVSLPVYAAIMDVNYHPKWREQCISNLEIWAARSERLICISHFTAQEAARFIPTAAHKLTPVPIACQGKPATARAQHKTNTSPLLYYPASYNPHKGHAILLAALQRLLKEGMKIRLVLTGGPADRFLGPNPIDELELEKARTLLAENAMLRQAVKVHDHVTNEVVENYYEEADLIVLPTQYEGFGLPLSEALIRGKRVLCSSLPTFHEQIRMYGCKKSVRFVSDASDVGWSNAIRDALQSPSEPAYTHEQLQTAFASWTWRNVAEAYLSVFHGAKSCRMPVQPAILPDCCPAN